MGKKTDGTNAGTMDFESPPFPNGGVPKIMIVTLTGIERTPYGLANGAPPPPNRNFLPERKTCTGWPLLDEPWHGNVGPESNSMDLDVEISGASLYPVFRFTDLSKPCFTGDNELIDPATNYYVGGRFALTWVEHFGPDSAFFLMDAFGIRRGPPVMLEQIPQPDFKAISRFADRRDGTCVRIKLDKNWGIWLPKTYWEYTALTHDLKILLVFKKYMDMTSTPAPKDFVFCEPYKDEILFSSCEWLGDVLLELHATLLAPPTENSYFNYVKGTYPLKFDTGVESVEWNHMYFPGFYPYSPEPGFLLDRVGCIPLSYI